MAGLKQNKDAARLALSCSDAAARPHYASIRSPAELAPANASLDRSLKQSSAFAFGETHLFGKCGSLAYAIRDSWLAMPLQSLTFRSSQEGKGRGGANHVQLQ